MSIKDQLIRAQEIVRIGDIAPDFTANTTQGDKNFYDYIEGKWAILFSHPLAHTPVCTTELGRVAQLKEEWASRDTVVIGLSVDTDVENQAWLNDINEVNKTKVEFPIINDADYAVSKLYGMINQDHCKADGMPLTARTVFFIDPKKKVRCLLVYPASVGRNATELLRILESLQLTDSNAVATPVDWNVTQPDGSKSTKCLVLPTIPTAKAREMFPDVDEVRPYLRFVDQPKK